MNDGTDFYTLLDSSVDSLVWKLEVFFFVACCGFSFAAGFVANICLFANEVIVYLSCSFFGSFTSLGRVVTRFFYFAGSSFLPPCLNFLSCENTSFWMVDSIQPHHSKKGTLSVSALLYSMSVFRCAIILRFGDLIFTDWHVSVKNSFIGSLFLR